MAFLIMGCKSRYLDLFSHVSSIRSVFLIPLTNSSTLFLNILNLYEEILIFGIPKSWTVDQNIQVYITHVRCICAIFLVAHIIIKSVH